MKLLILAILGTLLWSQNLNYETFQGDFEQTITNHSGNQLKYSGSMIASKKNIIWRYTKPISKEVYILDKKVIINEPELEQTIYTTLKSEINIATLIENAKEIKPNTYETVLEDTTYTIKFENEILLMISFLDKIENKVVITFKNQKKDIELQPDSFLFIQNPDFDIIKQ